jgi:hypothetical protein
MKILEKTQILGNVKLVKMYMFARLKAKANEEVHINQEKCKI